MINEKRYFAELIPKSTKMEVNYKKKYEEALKWIRELYPTMVSCADKEAALRHFPELAESDDERIRKEMLDFFKGFYGNSMIKSVDVGPWIAWLEKKCKQKPADKVEPKFKVGDWVICRNGSHRVFQVIERSWPNAKYLDEKGAGGFLNVATLDKQYRPWTIKDAKAGDLLADDYGIYIFDRFFEYDEKCFYCMGAYQRSQKVYENEHMLCSVEVHPATKEQRDLLFQKMHESGYEWDADKKESKKIEQKPAEWSEEDEQYLLVCKNALAKYQTTDKWDAHIISNWLENKLKSRRPQNVWISVDKEVYVKEPVLAQKKDKSDQFKGYVVCCDHTLIPNVYERYMILSNIVSQSTWKTIDEKIGLLPAINETKRIKL